MNFTEDVLERFPASALALVSINAEGDRREWVFGELSARSAGLSGAFAERGVRRGDVVMTLVGNRVEWVLSLLACWRMGAVALPCSTQLRADDLAYRAEASGAALAVGSEELLGLVPGDVTRMSLDEVWRSLDEDRPQATPTAVADLRPDDGALIVFTSGTTGKPRAALHGQRYLFGQSGQAEHWVGARPGEVAWCTTATGWSKSARNVFVAPWLQGATAMIHDGRFDPAERLDLIEREQVAVLCQSPTEYRLIAKHADLRPLPSLRRMVSAGEALNAEVVEAFTVATGVPVCDGYGQTETGHIAGTHVGDEVVPGSMGRPLAGIEVRISDEGELQVRRESCPTFFERYLGEDPFDGEWWPTGDLVSRDDDGRLWFEGRRDDVIVSSGYRIGPFEVESALISHPAVVEAAAVAAPDQERGSVVKAVVVTRDGSAGDELAAELQEHVKRVTAPYKFPRIIEFATELPKTASGKIKRAQLRADHDQARDQADADSEPEGSPGPRR